MKHNRTSADTAWIIDVGAFDGVKGLNLRQSFGGNHPLLLVEPEPGNFSLIPSTSGTLKLNVAIASYDGEIDLHLYHPATHSVLEIDQQILKRYIDGDTGNYANIQDWQTSKKLRVPCYRLDSLCRKYQIKHIRFLKVDTQGFDLEVIRSLGDDIQMVDELVCEVQLDQAQIYKNASTKQEILDYLHSKGFLFMRQEYQSYGQEANLYFERKDRVGGLEKEPLISILTPSFNSEKFIEACIQSVLQQKYPHYEHLIQDGGSRDGTLEIFKKYEGKINWVSEKDNGQSDGLNRAIQRSRGDILIVLNSDDELLPGALEWAVRHFAKHPDMAVVYGQQYNVNEFGEKISESFGPQPYRFDRLFCCQDVIPAQAAFIRRSALESVGLHADVTRKTCPDYEMWVRLGLKHKMKFIPGFVANYRLHAGSEGQQEDVIYKMVESKHEVIDRICADPSTPWHVKCLKLKAKAGVFAWSACHFLPPAMFGKKEAALNQLKKSLRIYPNMGVFLRLMTLQVEIKIPQWAGISCSFFDWKEFLRVLRRISREIARGLDRWILGGLIYRRIYLPRKNKRMLAQGNASSD